MRNYFMELLGTFFLVFTILYTGNALAIGLIFMAMIYIGSHVSGAHYNPAVTVAHSLGGVLSKHLSSHYYARHINGIETLFYILAQIIGASLAAGLMYLLSGQAVLIEFPTTLNLLIPAGFEALFALVLCLVILTITASDHFREIKFHGLAIGLTLAGIAFIPPLIVNPAVALGSIVVALLTGTKTAAIVNAFIVHILPPLVGAVAAVLAFAFLNPKRA